MSNSVKSLILCVHSHQPVGNFDNVFAEAYEKSYKPFFEVLEKHPSISLVSHFSGSLLDWLEVHRPDFIAGLKKISDRGQVEFLGGAYYEPIYGLIPSKDLIGQIRLMQEKVRSLFGKTPEGAWLTERVWDPGLVKPLRKAGVEYTILDDFHFEKAGKKLPVTGYYRTKDGKDTLDLFGSMKDLRYLLPFRKAGEAVDFIHSLRAAEEEVIVFADDSEKFGHWPGTYDWVYKSGWLDEFFTLLEKDKAIRLYTFSQFRERFPAKGTVRVPHGSYSEMMEWSGGHFYNFLKKYPESRYMRDRMIGVSRALETTNSTNGFAAHFESAKKALYKAQCNCPYWHGVFGGLYLHHLRSAVFGNLIQTEKFLLRSDKHSKDIKDRAIHIEKMPSGDRIRLNQKEMTSFFNPAYGASLEELDFLPKSVNLMCNLQRHPERYHETVFHKSTTSPHELSIYELLGSREKDLEKEIHYDPYRRLSFMDHFFENEISLDDFAKSRYEESGDFVDRPYALISGRAKSLKEISFERKGFVKLRGRKHPLVLRKRVAPAGRSGLEVRYGLQNKSRESLDFVLGVEFNFSIGEKSAAEGLFSRGVKEWVLNDSWQGLKIKLYSKTRTTFLAAPVETVSESEYGLEKTYQELSVLLQREFHLKPGGAAEHVLGLEVLD